MNNFKLLLVEDSDQDLGLCTSSAERYSAERQRVFELVACRTVKEAFEKLDASFDGAIIDLKLAGQGDEGNEVMKRITEYNLRIPVAIFTGTPDPVNPEFPNVGVYKKGETSYDDLFNMFWGIHQTGLTRIVGGRGLLERALADVFKKNLLPNRKPWVAYGAQSGERTEKALLRFTLNHLLQLLEDDTQRSFPEEVYISPPYRKEWTTGSIIQRINDQRALVVLNPACDLVLRKNGDCKTDRILLVEVDDEDSVLKTALEGITKRDKRESAVTKFFSNNYTDFYHWLPRTLLFAGGFLNFRKATTHEKERLLKEFTQPEIQISPSFVKDITARFSAYYARQGQPDIDCDASIRRWLEPVTASRPAI